VVFSALLLALTAFQAISGRFQGSRAQAFEQIAIALPAVADGADPAPGKRGRDDDDRVDREYKSGALPKEETRTVARMRRANENFEREQWAEGLVLLDEILAEATSPDYRRRRLLEAAKRARDLERKLEELEKQANAENEGGMVRAGGPAGGNQGLEGVEADDVRTPTVEVYSRDGIRYRRTADELLDLILQLPEEGRAVYLRTYEPAAKNALAAALEVPFESSYAALRRVGERYALTPSGCSAWIELAGRLADASRHSEAAAALDARLGLPFEESFDDEEEAEATRHETLAHAALLHLLAGHVEAARHYLAEVSSVHSEETVLIRGEAVLGTDVPDHPLFATLLAEKADVEASPSEWPAPLGSYAHTSGSTHADHLPAIGTTAKWIYRLREIPRQPKGSTRSSIYRGRNLALQLVTDDERIFVRQQNAIVALDPKTGERRWVSDLDDRATFQQTGRNVLMLGQAATNGAEDYKDLGSKSLTYARISTGAGQTRGVVFAVDHMTQARTARGGQVEYQANRILALDSRNGKLLWRLGAAERKRDPTHGLAFIAPPSPAGDMLIVPAIRESGFYLAGITTGGKLAWITRLYSFNATYYQRYGAALVGGSMVATSGGIAVAAPGNGFVSAVDTSTGRLLWMTRYRSRVRENRSTGHFHHPQPMIAQTSSGPVVLVAPPDSDFLTAIEPRTGNIRWEKRPEDSSIAILGCDDDHVYFAGARLAARSLVDGSETWSTSLSSDGHGFASGSGFLAAGRLYIPRTGSKLLTVDAQDGTVLEHYAIIDAKVPTNFSHNIFPVGGQLIALGSWGLASIEPQADSWAHLKEEPGRRGFERARLLRSEGKHEESLDLLYDLLGKARSKKLRGQMRSEIISTVRILTSTNKDPAPIDRLLAFGRKDGEIVKDPRGEKLPPLVSKRVQVLGWRLLQAKLLWSIDRKKAVERYLELLLQDGYRARCPESNDVDVRIFASDILREIRYSPSELDKRWIPPREKKDKESDEEHEAKSAEQEKERKKALEELAKFVEDALSREDEKAAEALETALASKDAVTELFKVATRRSHTKRSAEASAQLAVRAWADNSPADAGNHLGRLKGDYPKLRGVAEIESELEALHVEPEPEPVLRGIDFSELLAARERLARAKAEVDKENAKKKEGEKNAQLPMFSSPWRQVFWHEIEQGILASGAPGADPLPVILTLRGNNLCAVDTDGEILMERELADFPDLEEVKTRLQSHIEEPASCHLQGRRLVFFTAAGIYAFDIGNIEKSANGDPVTESGGAPPPRILDLDARPVVRAFDARPVVRAFDARPVVRAFDARPVVRAFDARQFKLAWAQTYDHGLEKYVSRMNNFGFFGSMRLPNNQNLFPVVEFSHDGDPTILQPNGDYLRVDRRSGKLIWRFASESATVLGKPMKHDNWIEVQSVSPPGLLRYRPPNPETGIGKRSTFLAGPANTRSTAIVDGIANIFQASRLEVRAAKTERVLWKRSTSSRLVYATPSEVWTTSSGSIKARTLRSGRALYSIQLPETTAVQTHFANPHVDGRGRTFVCSQLGYSHSTRRVVYYGSATYQTGGKLWVVHLVPQDGSDREKVAWKTQLAKGSVTYDGNRYLLEDGSWLFAFNEQDTESEKWYTRIARVDPKSGDAELWINVEISGKGTGQPPRLCPVAGGLAVGNSEGYGWFTTELPPLESEEDEEKTEDVTKKEPDGDDAGTTGKGNTE